LNARRENRVKAATTVDADGTAEIATVDVTATEDDRSKPK
jgi:hypothetical protein